MLSIANGKVVDSVISFGKCNNDKITLATNVSALVAAANLNRIYLLLENLSDIPITVSFSEANAVLGKGMVLLTKGSSFEMSDKIYNGRISAIASSAAELSVVECSLG